MRPRALMGWTFVAGAAVTLAVSLLPFIRFVYRNRSLQITLETTIVLIGLLSALIIFGRFRQRGALQDLAVVAVPLQPPPVKPSNVEPAAGLAVSA